MHPQPPASDHRSERSWLTGLAESLLDSLSVVSGALSHLFDLRPGLRTVNMMLKHVSDNFKPGLGHLIDEGFEFVACGHSGERYPIFGFAIYSVSQSFPPEPVS